MLSYVHSGDDPSIGLSINRVNYEINFNRVNYEINLNLINLFLRFIRFICFTCDNLLLRESIMGTIKVLASLGAKQSVNFSFVLGLTLKVYRQQVSAWLHSIAIFFS